MKTVVAMSSVMLIAGCVADGNSGDAIVRGMKATPKTIAEDTKMGHMVIACYRPKPGKDSQLLELMKSHVPILHQQGLVTDRPSIAMRAQDGTIVEVFEWKSVEATQEAHTNPAVQAMWKQFEDACTYEVIGNLPEAKQLWSGYVPIDLTR
jgi:hypothetical protein